MFLREERYHGDLAGKGKSEMTKHRTRATQYAFQWEGFERLVREFAGGMKGLLYSTHYRRPQIFQDCK